MDRAEAPHRSRLQGRRPRRSELREGARELLPAAAGNGARWNEGLAGPIAAVRAGDEGVGLAPIRKLSGRRGGEVRLGEPYRAHQGHPTTNRSHVDAPVSIPPSTQARSPALPASSGTLTRSVSSTLRIQRRSSGRSVWATSWSMLGPETERCCSRSMCGGAPETTRSYCPARTPRMRRGRRTGGCS